jgi:1-acyl-sn-glycerol-3-phosphate acyltransferase
MDRPPRPSWLYFLVAILSYPVLRLLYRLRATGREHVPDGGCVLAANHWSNFDPWPLGIPLFPRRFLRFMAKKELYWPPLGWIVSAGGGFRVDRGKRDQQAIDTAVELCRAGHAVVMFPEGTRRSKGLVKRHEARWHSGAARIALEAGVPLVPAGIAGTERLARLGPLRVAYGPPIETADLSGRDPQEAAQVATDRLHDAITELERTVGSTPPQEAT